MEKESYLIVDSPFQLLCGVEYLLENSVSPISLIIVNNRVQNTLQLNQINNIYLSYKELFGSKVVYSINKQGVLSFYLFLATYKKITNNINSVDKLIIGDYANCYFRHLSNNVDSNELIILDDGFGTVKTASDIINNRLPLKEHAKRLFSLFTYNPAYLSNLKLFTIFYDYVKFKNKEENNFSKLKADLSTAPLVDELHFIGSPLVEDGIVDKDTYFRYISKVSSKYKSYGDIKYIPHRRESPIKIKLLSDRYDIKIKQIDKTIELFELHNEYLPKYILSFFSTALINLRKMLPETVQVLNIRLKEKEIIDRKNHINNIYEILAKEVEEESL